jgi:CxxC motif-containing protein (DUF1111 family)
MRSVTLTSALAVALAATSSPASPGADPPPPTEAPAAFDSQSNGFTDPATFELDKEIFEEREHAEDGLGPVFNAQACVECHQSPVTGGTSQIAELRAGKRDRRGGFVEAPGGSLINDRAIDALVQERVPGDANVRTFRASLSVLGDGFIEALANETILQIAERQRVDSRGRIRGEVVWVPILETPGVNAVGRFGWKNQHASLVSFAADAYLNEMGITTPLQPTENTSMGNSVAGYDTVADPEDDGADVEFFARFMRATKAPPRDETLAATRDAVAGARLFESIGCAHCHVSTLVTAPVGTVLHANFTVTEALGNKVIHPFSDFLLHDVGTGDGIVQNGGGGTANKLRTPPLWGLRTRSRLMHDGASLTLDDAILRHGNEAYSATREYRSLSSSRKRELSAFLSSL